MLSPSGEVQSDAAVNSGNTLCSWAETCTPEAALPLLDQAVAAYRLGLQQEEDALVWPGIVS